jgi:hypothetical protein
MNHQPFEIWLLEEQSLTPEQKRDLHAHLMTCKYCTALAETGVALHTKKMASPAAGFTARFEKRLAIQRVVERRRRILGVISLILGGLGLLVLLGGSTMLTVLNSPAAWITLGIGYLLFIVTSLQVLSEVSMVLFRVIPGLIPPFMWMVIVSSFAGLALLWTVSIWRFTRVTQGV